MDLDLGALKTGVVQIDNNGRIVLHVEEDDSIEVFEVETYLRKYVGQELRLTAITTASLNAMAAMLEDKKP